MAKRAKKETKAELSQRALVLEQENAVLKAAVEGLRKQSLGALVAFSEAITITNRNSPASYNTLAVVTVLFVVGLYKNNALDFTATPEDSQMLEQLCEAMGFDQVTATAITQKHQLLRRGLEMAEQGKSMDDVFREIDRLQKNEGGEVEGSE